MASPHGGSDHYNYYIRSGHANALMGFRFMWPSLGHDFLYFFRKSDTLVRMVSALFCVMLCYGMVCFVMLCYVMLCDAMSHMRRLSICV